MMEFQLIADFEGETKKESSVEPSSLCVIFSETFC
jgi:hypothetical protein